MNIMFLIRSFGFSGGAERQLSVLAQGLQAQGHQVTIAVLYAGSLNVEQFNADYKIIDLKKKGFWDILGFLGRFFQLMRNVQPDVLHGYLPMQNLLVLLGRFIVPKAKVVWGLRASTLGFDGIRRSEQVFFKLSCWLSSKADLIIANSEAGKKFHIDKGYSKFIEVVPNGIDTEYFQRNELGRQRMRNQWGIADHEILVGNVARLVRIKDHPTFLRACAILQKNHSQVKFVCAGEDSKEYRQDLEQLAQELNIQDSLIWAGECSDMPSVYSALDLEVLSSTSEGLPNAVAEAMSCGVAVVATDVGDVKVLLDNIGICVPPSNPEELAEQMAVMLQNDIYGLGQRGRKHIVEHYSMDRLVARTESLLRSVTF